MNDSVSPDFQFWKGLKAVSERAPARDFVPMVAIAALANAAIFMPGSDLLRGFFGVMILVVVIVARVTHGKTTEKQRDGPTDTGIEPRGQGAAQQDP